MASGEITLGDVAAEIRRGTRVILLVRHGERTRIDPDDPTFGDGIALTDEGVRTARLFGAALAEFKDRVQFCASPLRRTLMTAELIAEGMGVPQEIPTDDVHGNSTFYYADPLQIVEIFKEENFFNACIEYFEKKEQRGFHNLDSATDAWESWLLAHRRKQLYLVATHDLYIAAFLSSRGTIAHFSKANWPCFLDAAAIFIDDDGSRRYALVRSGFSSGISGVTST